MAVGGVAEAEVRELARTNPLAPNKMPAAHLFSSAALSASYLASSAFKEATSSSLPPITTSSQRCFSVAVASSLFREVTSSSKERPGYGKMSPHLRGSAPDFGTRRPAPVARPPEKHSSRSSTKQSPGTSTPSQDPPSQLVIRHLGPCSPPSGPYSPPLGPCSRPSRVELGPSVWLNPPAVWTTEASNGPQWP
ncbi:lysine-rich arabinogalactan protein 19-like [Cajanus cajan]|uniref:lysine-rich arabinogalactan protein 19-like n=1 Tax=Cajanus cajan TaxID=3821 RepID=UPI00098D9223|nr:lysine-rich arabinogalactan protein 19-like [Cajanus cajan]